MGFRRCFDLGMNFPALRCWSGGRDHPAALVQEQSCFEGAASLSFGSGAKCQHLTHQVGLQARQRERIGHGWAPCMLVFRHLVSNLSSASR